MGISLENTYLHTALEKMTNQACSFFHLTIYWSFTLKAIGPSWLFELLVFYLHMRLLHLQYGHTGWLLFLNYCSRAGLIQFHHSLVGLERWVQSQGQTPPEPPVQLRHKKGISFNYPFMWVIIFQFIETYCFYWSHPIEHKLLQHPGFQTNDHTQCPRHCWCKSPPFLPVMIHLLPWCHHHYSFLPG